MYKRNIPSRRNAGNRAATPDELHTVMQLYRAGTSKAQIARQTGFSSWSVYNIIKRFTVGGQTLPPASNYAPKLPAAAPENPARNLASMAFEDAYRETVDRIRAAAPGVTGMVSITVSVPF